MKYPIELTKNCNNHDVYAFNIDGTLIYCLTMSECGRFVVNPLQHYGLEKEDVDFLHQLNERYGFNDSI